MPRPPDRTGKDTSMQLKRLHIARSLILSALAVAWSAAAAQAQTVKVGFITSFSGQNASIGEQMDQAVKLWTKEHEKDLPPGGKIEIIRRDDTGPNPEVAKRLAQGLITRDQGDLLSGVVWTPHAISMAPVTAPGKTAFV